MPPTEIFVDLSRLQFALTAMYFAMILGHVLISAVITRIVGAGHKAGAVVHVVGMLWLAAIVYYGVEYVMTAVL